MKRLIFSVLPVIVLCVIFSMVISAEFNKSVLNIMEDTGWLKSFCDTIFNSLIKPWWSKKPFISFRIPLVILIGFFTLFIYYLICKLLDFLFGLAFRKIRSKQTKRPLVLAYGGAAGYNDRYAKAFNDVPAPKVVSSLQVNAIEGYYEKLNPLRYKDLVSSPGLVSMTRLESIKMRDESVNKEPDAKIFNLLEIFDRETQPEEVVAEQAPIIVPEEIAEEVNLFAESFTSVWKGLVPVISDESIEADYNEMLFAQLSQNEPDRLPYDVIIDDEIIVTELQDFYYKRLGITRPMPVVSDPEPIVAEPVAVEPATEPIVAEPVEEVIVAAEAPAPIVEPVREEVIPVEEIIPTANFRRRRNVGGETEFFQDIQNTEKIIREKEYIFVQGVRPRKRFTDDDLFSASAKRKRRTTTFAYTGKQG